MKAAFLIRCSTKNQDLSRQTRDLTRLAKSFGFEYDLDNLVFGEKITGKDDVTKRNRESIDRLLKAAKEQKFDIVLVSEVSRMSRDPASGRVYVRLLINMGIPVYFKDIDTWTIDPQTGKKVRDAEIVIGGAFDAAWKYLKSMKTQIASARRNQLDNGAISVGRPYFGYKWHGGKDKTVKTKWVVDEDAKEVVVAAFNEYLKEGATLKSTALAITDKYGEKLGRKFSIGSVEHILTFESYHTGIKSISLYDPDREITEVYDVPVPKLIPTELYLAAKAKRESNALNINYPQQTTYTFSKLIKCPYCGYTMTPKFKASDKTPDGRGANGSYRIINGLKAMSWVCMSGVNKATTCTNRMSIANEKLEPIIWELIKRELIYFANLNNEEKERKLEEIAEKIEYQNYTISNYDKELEKLKKRTNTAFTIALSAAEAAGDDEELKAMAMEQYQQAVKSIRKEQNNYLNSIDQSKDAIKELESLRDFYNQPNLTDDVIKKAESDSGEKRNLVKELITKIVPYKITTYEKWKREKGKGAFKERMTVKFGMVLLEVYTVNGIYYILYNANGKEPVRYAYYMSGKYVTYQNSLNKLEDREDGEYFVLLNKEGDDELTPNQFEEIAKAQQQVLEYQYKPEM